MKKFLLSLLAILLLLPCWGASPAVTLEQLQKTLQEKVAYTLYKDVKKQLQQYYQRESFASSQEWLRVNAFLRWLKEHEAELEFAVVHGPEQTVRELLSSKEDSAQAFLWSYLGARYAAELYSVPAEAAANRLRFEICEGGACVYSYSLREMVTVFVGKKDSFVGYLNIGMHETAHLLSILSSHPSLISYSLTELATFKVQHTHALPLKINSENKFFGIRDFRILAELNISPLTNEYTGFVWGLLLDDQEIKKLMYTSTDDYLGYDKAIYGKSLVGYILSTQGKLFYRIHHASLKHKGLVYVWALKMQYPIKKLDSLLTGLTQTGDLVDLGPVSWEQITSAKPEWAEDKEFKKYFEKDSEKIHLFLKKKEKGYEMQVQWAVSPEKQLHLIVPKDNPKIMEFYRQLPNYLSQGFLDKLAAQPPAFGGEDTEKLAPIYEEDVMQALVKAVNKLAVQPKPVVPRGYF